MNDPTLYEVEYISNEGMRSFFRTYTAPELIFKVYENAGHFILSIDVVPLLKK